jgi:hypothetical protein
VKVTANVDEGRITAECRRCGSGEELGRLSQHDAENALGKFTCWHRTCLDREEFERRREAARRRAERFSSVPMAFVREVKP